ncbi:MAG: dimethylamine monooxygenase subunit DmmA family protein [Pseudorhodoplanes sp.]
MLVEGIKSRPRYPGLVADGYAKHHVVVADGYGAQAIFDLFDQYGSLIKGRIEIVYAETSGTDYTTRLSALPADIVHNLPTLITAIQRLKGALGAARMGTRIYAAGSETLIGLVVQLVQELGMDPQTVLTEHRGTLARRVQCVHCKGFTENVTTNIAMCSHCGANLLVRDHYSRRLAAFQGVCVDAEVPGEIPEIVEVFK